MKRKIDHNQPPLRNSIPWRTMFGAVILCFMTSVTSFGQSSYYASLVETQSTIESYNAMLLTIDLSTPEGAAEKASLVAKIANLTILANKYYLTLSGDEQLNFQNWAEQNHINDAPAPSPELLVIMNGSGTPSGTSATSTTTGTSGSAATQPWPPAGPYLSIP